MNGLFTVQPICQMNQIILNIVYLQYPENAYIYFH
jgi:hypothetical protein